MPFALRRERPRACQPVRARSVMGVHVPAQLEVQDRVGKLADLDEQIAEMHKRLEKQLLQQLDTQERLRCTASFMLSLLIACAGTKMIAVLHSKGVIAQTLSA